MTDRSVGLTIRLTLAERDAMHAAADADGLTLSAWLRQMALRAARRPRLAGAPPPARETP